MKTTLFLDFDGVLHPDGAKTDQLFGPRSMQLLADVVADHVDLDVVISSSWREIHSLEDLQGFLPARMRQRVVGCTPARPPVEELPGDLWSFIRHGECWAWLATEGRINYPWIALDDQTWRFAPGCPQLLLINGRVGFSEADAQELRRRLHVLAQGAGGCGAATGNA